MERSAFSAAACSAMRGGGPPAGGTRALPGRALAARRWSRASSSRRCPPPCAGSPSPGSAASGPSCSAKPTSASQGITTRAAGPGCSTSMEGRPSRGKICLRADADAQALTGARGGAEVRQGRPVVPGARAPTIGGGPRHGEEVRAATFCGSASSRRAMPPPRASWLLRTARDTRSARKRPICSVRDGCPGGRRQQRTARDRPMADTPSPGRAARRRPR